MRAARAPGLSPPHPTQLRHLAAARHIDAFAAESVLFEKAYVQQSICSPTRNSFLSGRYPDRTRTWK